jgi:hypothetical protein
MSISAEPLLSSRAGCSGAGAATAGRGATTARRRSQPRACACRPAAAILQRTLPKNSRLFELEHPLHRDQCTVQWAGCCPQALGFGLLLLRMLGRSWYAAVRVQVSVSSLVAVLALYWALSCVLEA